MDAELTLYTDSEDKDKFLQELKDHLSKEGFLYLPPLRRDGEHLFIKAPITDVLVNEEQGLQVVVSPIAITLVFARRILFRVASSSKQLTHSVWSQLFDRYK